jgi:hypothetical protein
VTARAGGTSTSTMSDVSRRSRRTGHPLGRAAPRSWDPPAGKIRRPTTTPAAATSARRFCTAALRKSARRGRRSARFPSRWKNRGGSAQVGETRIPLPALRARPQVRHRRGLALAVGARHHDALVDSSRTESTLVRDPRALPTATAMRQRDDEWLRAAAPLYPVVPISTPQCSSVSSDERSRQTRSRRTPNHPEREPRGEPRPAAILSPGLTGDDAAPLDDARP